MRNQVQLRRIGVIAVSGILASVIIATIIAHVYSPGPLPILLRSLRDSLHAPGFAVVAILVLSIIRLGRDTRHPYVVAFGICVSLAGIAEASQVLTSRDADLVDFGADFLGVIAGLLIISLYFGDVWHGPKATLRPIVIAFTTAVCFLCIFPAADTVHAIVAQRLAMPNLATFESRWETRLYSGSLDRSMTLVPSPNTFFRPGQRSALLHIGIPSVSGLEFFPYSDWTNYQYLSFTVASGSGLPFQARMRIHDVGHNNEYEDRFSITFEVPVEPTTIRLSLLDVASGPEGRRLDLSNVEAIIFFGRSGDEKKIYIDNIRLEN